MTRKDALRLAMQALTDAGAREDAVAVLRTMAEELPLIRWTDAAIRDSIEQFIQDHGRVPTVTDFKKRGLPPHTVIQNKYGVTLHEWLRENYPAPEPSLEAVRAAVTEAFKQDYLRVRPCSADEYDAQRAEGCRCWYTVAVRNGCRSWRALLARLGLPVFSRVEAPRPSPTFLFQIDTDLSRLAPEQREAFERMVRADPLKYPPRYYQTIRTADQTAPNKERFVLRYRALDRVEADEAKAAASELTSEAGIGLKQESA